MLNINYVGCTRPLTLAKLLLSELSTPKSLDLLNHIYENDWDKYFKEGINHSEYDNSRDVALDSLALSLLKKSPNILSSDIDIKTVEGFEKAEEQCRQTNTRFANLSDLGPHNDEFLIMRSKIASILGNIPKTLKFGFGPGVNVGCKGVDTGSYAKYSKHKPSITPLAARFGELYLKDTLWGQYLSRGSDNKMSFDITPCAEIAFVPKNYKIKRTITIDPLLNTYFQKGIGGYMRKCLKSVGVDLRRQSINQEAAGRAQADGLCTVDFTSASDNISRRIVLELLPIDWSHVLDTFRTHYAKTDSKFYILEKFSSMGNGFTFELESLLFYAAAYAVVKLGSGRLSDISVYGDDVIIPQSDYPAFLKLTSFMGFSINTEKSFIDGRFFESCGMDYFDGTNVRPFYLKNDLTSDYDIFECRNALLAFSHRWKIDLSQSLGFLQNLIPGERRLRVPFPYPGGFWKTPFVRDRNYTIDGWEGSIAKAMFFKPRKRQNDHFEPALLHSLNSPSLGFRTLRRVGNFKVKLLFFPAI